MSLTGIRDALFLQHSGSCWEILWCTNEKEGAILIIYTDEQRERRQAGGQVEKGRGEKGRGEKGRGTMKGR